MNSGTDIAVEVSEIVLVKDSLLGVAVSLQIQPGTQGHGGTRNDEKEVVLKSTIIQLPTMLL